MEVDIDYALDELDITKLDQAQKVAFRQIEKHIAALQAVVDKLPRTADGVTVQVDMTLYWVTRKGEIAQGYVITSHHHIGGQGWVKLGRRGDSGPKSRSWRRRPSECYATRSGVLAAKIKSKLTGEGPDVTLTSNTNEAR